jgi:DNA ligase-1
MRRLTVPDLLDGESVEMKGSGSRPYVLKNVGGVYSCSCPAWRNQSLGIERRTCKHLRKLRGDLAETARVGSDLPARPAADAAAKVAPPLLLAESWDGAADLAGWLMSEKLDGVRAYWTGKGEFLSRLGNPFHVPDWFTAGLPRLPLDGEFWIDRKAFQRTVGIVRRQDKTDLWNQVRFLIFDAPDSGGGFEQRLQAVERVLRANQPPYARAHEHIECADADHLRRELARVEALGGEGLMFRQPASHYQAGRSSTLLKVKSFADAEARVVGHEPGKGRHKGRLGALLAELSNGVKFAVGTGLSDAERNSPPPVGSTITFRYQELTDGGVPRFPSYVGVRVIAQSSATTPTFFQGESAMPNIATLRRFEYVAGSSDKFWAVAVNGTDVVVNYGRNGTAGQSNTKSFADPAAAQKHADKLIQEKTGNGYVEVRPGQ